MYLRAGVVSRSCSPNSLITVAAATNLFTEMFEKFKKNHLKAIAAHFSTEMLEN